MMRISLAVLAVTLLPGFARAHDARFYSYDQQVLDLGEFLNGRLSPADVEFYRACRSPMIRARAAEQALIVTCDAGGSRPTALAMGGDLGRRDAGVRRAYRVAPGPAGREEYDAQLVLETDDVGPAHVRLVAEAFQGDELLRRALDYVHLIQSAGDDDRAEARRFRRDTRAELRTQAAQARAQAERARRAAIAALAVAVGAAAELPH